MQQRSDDRLLAYLDGELERGAAARGRSFARRRSSCRQRMAALAESANLLRLAF